MTDTRDSLVTVRRFRCIRLVDTPAFLDAVVLATDRAFVLQLGSMDQLKFDFAAL